MKHESYFSYIIAALILLAALLAYQHRHTIMSHISGATTKAEIKSQEVQEKAQAKMNEIQAKAQAKIAKIEAKEKINNLEDRAGALFGGELAEAPKNGDPRLGYANVNRGSNIAWAS